MWSPNGQAPGSVEYSLGLGMLVDVRSKRYGYVWSLNKSYIRATERHVGGNGSNRYRCGAGARGRTDRTGMLVDVRGKVVGSLIVRGTGR